MFKEIPMANRDEAPKRVRGLLVMLREKKLENLWRKQ